MSLWVMECVQCDASDGSENEGRKIREASRHFFLHRLVTFDRQIYDMFQKVLSTNVNICSHFI